jgi:hypothetical protein
MLPLVYRGRYPPPSVGIPEGARASWAAGGLGANRQDQIGKDRYGRESAEPLATARLIEIRVLMSRSLDFVIDDLPRFRKGFGGGRERHRCSES